MRFDLRTAVENALDELRSPGSLKYIVYDPAPTGLGGQISGRIAALLVGLVTNRGIIFRRDDDPPYVQTFEGMGVHDSIALARFNSSRDELTPVVDLEKDQQETFLRLSPFETNLRSPVNERIIFERLHKKFEGHVESRQQIEGLAFSWMRPLDDVKAAIDAHIKRLGIDEKTLGVHVRRGDKRAETAYVPLSVIEAAVSQEAAIRNFTSVFLATDDPTLFKKIQIPRSWKLKYDEGEKRYNNANHKMLFSQPDKAREESITALCNIYALGTCGGVIGQDNAHFAVLAGALVSAKYGPSRVYLIAGDYAEKHSQVIAASWSAIRAVRALARKMLPFLTLKSKAKRIR